MRKYLIIHKRALTSFLLLLFLILSVIIIPKGNAVTYSYTYHEAMTNRGFETGTELNWTDAANDWDVTTIQHYNGTYSDHCANSGLIYQQLVITNYSLGIPVTQIMNISFWMRTESSSANTMCLIYYSDTSFTTQTFPMGAYAWTLCNINMLTLETAKNVTRLYFGTGINTNHWLDDASLIYRIVTPIIIPDYSGFYFKIGLGIISIIAVILAPILSDKVAETKFGKIFLCACIWLFFGFLFLQWIYMW